LFVVELQCTLTIVFRQKKRQLESESEESKPADSTPADSKPADSKPAKRHAAAKAAAKATAVVIDDDDDEPEEIDKVDPTLPPVSSGETFFAPKAGTSSKPSKAGAGTPESTSKAAAVSMPCTLPNVPSFDGNPLQFLLSIITSCQC
jgi:hypothetical protein